MKVLSKSLGLLASASSCPSSLLSATVTSALPTSPKKMPVGLFGSPKRHLAQFQSSRLEIHPTNPEDLREKPPVEEIGFGKVMTDHMLTCQWNSKDGWGAPIIEQVRPLQLHPASKVFHYAQELFEGMKAYRGKDDRIRLFRPMHNMARMNVSATRCCLPNFEGGELLNCIRELVLLDQEWVPHSESASLYIRPTMIGIEPELRVADSKEVLLFVLIGPAGPYYATGEMKPVTLLADPNFVRAFPGGCGYAKLGCNYAPTLWVQKQAEKLGCHQVLWLHGEDHEITEVGAMNMFVFLQDANGNKELVTPPLDTGIILPGVTRRSIVELTRQWGEFEVNERKICMSELLQAKQDGRLLEVFGAGTAAVVTPVGAIHYRGSKVDLPVPKQGLTHRILDSLNDIFYCRNGEEHPWAPELESWKIDETQVAEDYKRAAEQMQLQS